MVGNQCVVRNVRATKHEPSGVLKPETANSSGAEHIESPLCSHTRQTADGPEPSLMIPLKAHLFVIMSSQCSETWTAAEIIAQPIKKVLVIFNEMSW